MRLLSGKAVPRLTPGEVFFDEHTWIVSDRGIASRWSDWYSSLITTLLRMCLPLMLAGCTLLGLGQDPDATERPDWVIGVYPEENSSHSRNEFPFDDLGGEYHLCAELLPPDVTGPNSEHNRRLSWTEYVLDELVLEIDKKELGTPMLLIPYGEAEVILLENGDIQALDYGPYRCCWSTEGFGKGEHNARLTIDRKTGETEEYRWSFRITGD